jgi:hypothetical protein
MATNAIHSNRLACSVKNDAGFLASFYQIDDLAEIDEQGHLDESGQEARHQGRPR